LLGIQDAGQLTGAARVNATATSGSFDKVLISSGNKLGGKLSTQ
jgi:hypothetical protein